MRIKVATYNICHGEDHVYELKTGKYVVNLDAIVGVINKYSPDIIGLNEVFETGEKPEYCRQTSLLAEKCGYKFSYFGMGKEYSWATIGNSILSKFPIKNPEHFIVPEPQGDEIESGDKVDEYEQRCIIRADFNVGGGFRFYESHFGLRDSEKKKIVKKTVDLLDNEKGRYVFAGDLNMQPPVDILAPLLKRTNDTAALFDKPKASFPSEKPVLKIDYILTSKDIKAVSADIAEDVASDHRMYIAEIEV